MFKKHLSIQALLFITSGDGSKKSPSSPFDITQFEMFQQRNSPATSPPPDANKVSMYSRHSRNNSQTDFQLQQTNQTTPRSISPIIAQSAESAQKQVESIEEPRKQSYHDRTSDCSSPMIIKDEGKKCEEEGSQRVSPRTSAKLKLDELVIEHANLIQPPSAREDSSIDKKMSADRASSTADRALEFENPVDTEESSSEIQTTSTASLLDDDDSRYFVCHMYSYSMYVMYAQTLCLYMYNVHMYIDAHCFFSLIELIVASLGELHTDEMYGWKPCVCLCIYVHVCLSSIA